jgi:alpha-L-rhamnosidase
MRRGVFPALAAGWLLAAAAPAAVSADSGAGAPPAAALSLQPIADDPSWAGQVLDPPRQKVAPAAVTVTGAGITNPGALVSGQGVTTLTSAGGTPPHLVVDMGVNTGGFVEVGLQAGGTTDLQLGYSETNAYLTQYGDNLDSGRVYFDLATDDKITACTGPFGPAFRCDIVSHLLTSWTSPSVRGAERYIWVQPAGTGTVSITSLRIRRESFAPSASDYRGHFLSSDPLLNRAWYGSAYTNDLDTVNHALAGGNHVFVDGAKRDRASYTGDAGRQIATAMYGGAVPDSVSRDFLAIFPCYQTPSGYIAPAAGLGSSCPAGAVTPVLPPGTGTVIGGPSPGIGLLNTYVAIYVRAVADYYLFTGDLATVRSLLPACEMGAKYLKSYVSNGLIVSSADTTWSLDAFTGAQSFENAYYIRALDGLADMEAAAGNTAGADAYRQEAASVRAAMRALLWDARSGAYLTGVPNTVDGHSLDGNSQAILARVADPGQQAGIVALLSRMQGRFGTLTDDLPNDPFMHQFYSPFAGGMELDARLTAYDTSGALTEVRRLWGYMMTTSPASTTWEKLMLDGTPESSAGKFAGGSSSMAHGWSTGPTEALSAYVGGLRPTTPGWTTWLIEPQTGDLAWAQTTAPTPAGPISSRWALGSGSNSLRLTVAAPPATSGTVAMPLLGARRVIAEDGVVVWDGVAPVGTAAAASDGRYVRFAAVSGSHTFAWSGSQAATVATAGITTLPNSMRATTDAAPAATLIVLTSGLFLRRRRARHLAR